MRPNRARPWILFALAIAIVGTIAPAADAQLRRFKRTGEPRPIVRVLRAAARVTLLPRAIARGRCDCNPTTGSAPNTPPADPAPPSTPEDLGPQPDEADPFTFRSGIPLPQCRPGTPCYRPMAAQIVDADPEELVTVPAIVPEKIREGLNLIETPCETQALYMTFPKGDDLALTEASAVELRSEDRFDRVIRATVRVTVNGVCGSGTVVGERSGKKIVLTNAHVAGTRRGRVVNLERWNVDGSGERGTGAIIAAGYGRGLSIDFALLECSDGFAADVTPIPLAERTPDQASGVTTFGCPRCEWPSLQVLRMLKAEGQVLRWHPAAIGGRSGSSLVDYESADGPRVVGLLTWGNGSEGLGQSTPFILDALRGRLPTSFEAIPTGARELAAQCCGDAPEQVATPKHIDPAVARLAYADHYERIHTLPASVPGTRPRPAVLALGSWVQPADDGSADHPSETSDADLIDSITRPDRGPSIDEPPGDDAPGEPTRDGFFSRFAAFIRRSIITVLLVAFAAVAGFFVGRASTNVL